MDFLRQFNIQQRLWGVLSITLIGFILVALLSVSHLKDDMYAAKDEKNRNLVEVIHSIIQFYYNKQTRGELTEQQAQTMAKDVIRAVRYENTNYFWINNMQAFLVMHPIRTELDGTDVSQYKDPTGNAIYTGFARVAREQGEGRYEYMFPKPGGDEPMPKFSHVKGFEPWGWVIGTGTYVDDVDEKYWATLTGNGVVVTGLAILLGGVVLLVVRSIVLPLRHAQNAMQDIATGDGNLRSELSITGQDELSKLSGNFNTFVGKIREMVSNVGSSVNQLSNAAGDLSTTSQQSTQGIAHQSEQINQVATAVGELASSLREVANGAEQVAEVVQGVEHDASQGMTQLTSTVTHLDSLGEEIDKAVTVIDTLAQKTETIGSILDVIRSIAEQTNLLALNAAIEAARAGEQGRGFAVVADEVRTLASRTQKSTEEIDEMIVQLQSESQQAVQVIKASQSRAEETSHGAAEVRGAFETITHSVARLNDMGNQNAAAITQQSATVESINQRIAEIHDISQQTSQLSSSTSQCGSHVAEISEELGKRMSGFSC